MEIWVKTGRNRYMVAEVGGFLALGRGSEGPQLATTIVSSSTTLAPTPRRQRLTTVGGWCEPIVQPFLSRFSSRRFCSQAFLWHKNAWMAKFGILGRKPAANTPQSGHHSAPSSQLLKPSIPRSTRRVRAHIPIEQPTTITLSVRGCLGGRSARGVHGSSAEGRSYVLYQAYGTKDKNC